MNSPSAPHRKNFEIILNRESGTIAKLGPELVERGLRKVFEEMGCAVTIHNVVGKAVPAALQAARDGAADAVIVGGGDGTVASAATVLSGGQKPLGILPLGTFNLAARDVGMTLDWQEAAQQLVTAPVAEMDLLDVAGQLYLCVVVLGFYPSLALGQPEYHGSWVVKTWRTVWKALRGAATFSPLQLELHDGETVHHHRTRMAVIANNDYEDLFGIIPQRRSLDAGFFTVYVSKHTTQWGMMKTALAWILGRWKEDREITFLRATSLEIRVRRKRRIAVMMDGELTKLPLPIHVKLMPKALLVIAPRLADLAPTNE